MTIYALHGGDNLRDDAEKIHMQARAVTGGVAKGPVMILRRR